MIRKSWLVAAMLVLTVLATGASAEEKLRIATEGAYPPFNYKNAKGELEGFDIDIARALCKAMNTTCEIVAEPWDTILTGLTDKRYDVIVASMAITPERDKVADFTEHYYRARSIFIGPKEFAAKAKGGADFAGKRIGVAKGTTQAAFVIREYSKIATVMEFENTDKVTEALLSGGVDIKLDDTLTGYDFLQSPKGKPYDFVGDPLAMEDVPSEARIAVRDGETKLRDAVNKAIHTIRLDGTYDLINRKYFPFSIY